MKRFKALRIINSIYKRLVYVLLAALLAASTTVSAFAAPTFNNYSISSSYKDPSGVTTAGGSLWYIEESASSPYANDYIGNMTTSGTVTDYSIGVPSGQTSFNLASLTTGSDGNVWFDGVANGESIYTGSLNISTGTVTFHNASASSWDNPGPIVTGSDGNLYFYYQTNNDPSYSYLLYVNPTTGVTATDHTFTSTYTELTSLTAGPDGKLWLVDDNGGWLYVVGTGTGGSISDYRVPTGDTNPRDITSGPDGNLWFVSDGKISKVTTSGTFTDYTLPSGASGAYLTAGPDDAVWFLYVPSSGGLAIGRMTTSGTLTDYTIPGTSISYFGTLTLGPDGAIWFTYTNSSGGQLGSITTAPTFNNYSISSSYKDPSGVTTAGGSLWYIEESASSPYANDYIGNMTTSGTVTDYSIGVPSGQTSFNLASLTTGSDGNVWFDGVANGESIYTGSLNISTGTVTFHNASASSWDNPGPIVTGSDGNLYFYYQTNNDPSYSYLLYVNPTTGVTATDHTFTSTYTELTSLTAGPDGKLWLVDDNGGWLYVVGTGTGGSISDYRVPTGDTNPRDITSGPDGNLWFVSDGKISKVTTSGTFTDYTLPSGASGAYLTAGPDDAVWFLYVPSSGGLAIGRMTTSGTLTDYTIPGTSISYFGTLTLGPDGAIWFTYTNSSGGQLGRLGY